MSERMRRSPEQYVVPGRAVSPIECQVLSTISMISLQSSQYIYQKTRDNHSVSYSELHCVRTKRMAPPRQRPPPSSIPGGGDDSRSEASSTATGGPTSRGVPGPKPRKAAANNATGGIPGAATTGTLASAKELKVAAATGAAAAAAANAAAAAMSGLGQGNGVDLYGLDGLRDDLPGVCCPRCSSSSEFQG